MRVRLRGLGATLHSSRFRWRRLLVKEYGTLFNWMAGVPIALYVRSHLFMWKGFSWHALDGILLSILGMAVFFWAGARYLKKGGLVVAD